MDTTTAVSNGTDLTLDKLTRWTFDGGMTAAVAEDGQWVRFADLQVQAARRASSQSVSIDVQERIDTLLQASLFHVGGPLADEVEFRHVHQLAHHFAAALIHLTSHEQQSAIPRAANPGDLRDDALEEAAKECERHADDAYPDQAARRRGTRESDVRESMALTCADAIRALKSDKSAAADKKGGA